MVASKRITRIVAAVAIAFAVNIATPEPADAFIHEIIAALCNGGDDVEPPGQLRPGASQVRALIASGLIVQIIMEPSETIVIFDPTVPNSKFISAEFNLTIPDGAGPGVDLTLEPFLIPDPDFPAHASCPLFE